MVEDKVEVAIAIGARLVDGSAVRRKVLGLLCFLVSRPRLSATRDEVLDALWPDFDPADALNSLNQTVYFLRRVFEPSFSEDLSPGYVNHEGDVVWLDPELVATRVQRCWDIIRGLPADPSPAAVAEPRRNLPRPIRARLRLRGVGVGLPIQACSPSFLQVVEKSVRSDIRERPLRAWNSPCSPRPRGLPGRRQHRALAATAVQAERVTRRSRGAVRPLLGLAARHPRNRAAHARILVGIGKVPY